MDKKEAHAWLKKHVHQGDTIYYIVKRVSNSGMYRHITFYTFKTKNEFAEGENPIQKVWLTRAISTVLGYTFKNKTDCIGISGCGMDMGFHVIHSLGHELFGDGYQLKSEQL